MVVAPWVVEVGAARRVVANRVAVRMVASLVPTVVGFVEASAAATAVVLVILLKTVE